MPCTLVKWACRVHQQVTALLYSASCRTRIGAGPAAPLPGHALLSNSFSLSHNEPPAPPSPPSGCGRGAGPASAAFRSANPSPLPPLQADVAEELGLPPQRSVTTRLRLSAIERHFYRRQHKVRRKGGGASRSGAGVLVLTQAV